MWGWFPDYKNTSCQLEEALLCFSIAHLFLYIFFTRLMTFLSLSSQHRSRHTLASPPIQGTLTPIDNGTAYTWKCFSVHITSVKKHPIQCFRLLFKTILYIHFSNSSSNRDGLEFHKACLMYHLFDLLFYLGRDI